MSITASHPTGILECGQGDTAACEYLPPYVGRNSPNALCTMAGTSKLSGIVGGVPRDSLVWSRSMFCEARVDNWEGGAVSVMSDRVRQDNSTQNA